jgi:hypothetical protein
MIRVLRLYMWGGRSSYFSILYKSNSSLSLGRVVVPTNVRPSFSSNFWEETLFLEVMALMALRPNTLNAAFFISENQF